MSDLRFALRSLAKSPGFALVAILSLALGIGANTAIFSLIDAVMLRSLPVEEPQELARVTFGEPGSGAEFTNPLWEEVRDRQDVFSGTFAYIDQRFDLAAGGESRPILGNWISGGFFPTLGVRPVAGRLIGGADDAPGCAPVAVLSEGFWRGEYGGDPAAIGRTVSLDGHPFEIIGVAPASFFGFDVGRSVQVYTPLCARPVLFPPTGGLDNHWFWFLRIAGRLRDGITVEEASRRLAAMAPSVYAATVAPDASEEMRTAYMDNSLGATPAANGYSDLRFQFDKALLVLMIVVGLVLLIACANVANLLLARATARVREMGIRLAIGADRARLVRQLLTESLLLALCGAAIGVVFAVWSSQLLVSYLASGPNALWLDLSINPRVLLFTGAVAVGTAVLFGLAPAWRSSRVEPHLAMKANDRTMAEGQSRFTMGKALVVAQITLSLTLVVAAGLLLGTFRRLATLDPGFDSDGVLVANFDLRNAGYNDSTLAGAKQQILERLRSTPGIRAAGASAIVPISGAGWNGGIRVDGFEPTDPRDEVVFFNAISDDFFATMRTTLLAGREFTGADRATSTPVAVVNQALARKFFPGRNPLGERIGLVTPMTPEPERYVEVVGVVDDTKYGSLREETRELLYIPMSQDGPGGPSLSVELRGDGPANALIPTVKAVAADMNPRMSLRFSVLSDAISSSLARERLLATLSGFFGGLAFLLAVIGLYGTLSYTVGRRRGEIGIRMALGAAGDRVMRMVLRDAGRLVALGLLLGGALTLVSTRLIASFLYGLSPTDPLTLLGSALALVVVALAASAIPAWRASRVNPMAVLREE